MISPSSSSCSRVGRPPRFSACRCQRSARMIECGDLRHVRVGSKLTRITAAELTRLIDPTNVEGAVTCRAPDQPGALPPYAQA